MRKFTSTLGGGESSSVSTVCSSTMSIILSMLPSWSVSPPEGPKLPKSTPLTVAVFSEFPDNESRSVAPISTLELSVS